VNIQKEILKVAKMLSAIEVKAIEFETEEAMKNYLKEHPDADASNHTVVDKKDDGGAKEDSGGSSVSPEIDKAIGDAVKEVTGKPPQQQKSLGSKPESKVDVTELEKRFKIDDVMFLREKWDKEMGDKKEFAKNISNMNDLVNSDETKESFKSFLSEGNEWTDAVSDPNESSEDIANEMVQMIMSDPTTSDIGGIKKNLTELAGANKVLTRSDSSDAADEFLKNEVKNLITHTVNEMRSETEKK
jgi:hypothetical protein